MLDDYHNITPTIIDEFDIKHLKEIVLSNTSGIHPLSRAIPTLSFSLTSFLHGDGSFGFKLHNLIIHLLCGLLIFSISKILLNSQKEPINNTKYLALAITAIWLLHPLHVSTVLYSVQRIAQFSTLFVLASIWIYLNARLSTQPYIKKLNYFVLFPLTVLLGLMSKENAALIFLYIFVIHVFLRSHLDTKNKLDSTFLYTLVLIPILLGLIVFYLKSDSLLNYSIRTFTIEERLITQIHIVAFYMKQLISPSLSQMGLFFDDIPVYQKISFTTLSLLSLHALLILSSAYGVLKKQVWAVYLSFFYLGHLTESTIIALEMVFEHRNYFPSFGLFGFIVVILEPYLKPVLKKTLLAIALIAFSALLFLRVGYWSNEHEWQKTSITFHPKSLRARISHSVYLLNYFGHEKANKEHLKAFNNFKTNPTYLLHGLSLECQFEENNYPYKTAIENLKRNGIPTSSINQLSGFTNGVILNDCKNINASEVLNGLLELIDIESKKKRSGFLGQLYAMAAGLYLKLEKYEEGNRLLLKSFYLTREPDTFLIYIFNLSKSENTKIRQYAQSLIERVKLNEFFDSSKYIDSINNIEKNLN